VPRPDDLRDVVRASRCEKTMIVAVEYVSLLFVNVVLSTLRNLKLYIETGTVSRYNK